MDNQIVELLKSLQQGQERMESKLDTMESKLNETHEIVKALEHKAEVNKAEHDKMGNDIAHIKGDVESLRKDMTSVEVITANNWADIAKLKAVK
ncbi:MAG: hypothetical protein ACRCX2_18750 [Paraclostridium sp.]